jgi:hypothetical protein
VQNIKEVIGISENGHCLVFAPQPVHKHIGAAPAFPPTDEPSKALCCRRIYSRFALHFAG